MNFILQLFCTTEQENVSFSAALIVAVGSDTLFLVCSLRSWFGWTQLLRDR